jgi:hypothetical protein
MEPPIVALHNKYLSALHNDAKSASRHLSNLRKLTIIGMPNSPVVKKQVQRPTLKISPRNRYPTTHLLFDFIFIKCTLPRIILAS